MPTVTVVNSCIPVDANELTLICGDPDLGAGFLAVFRKVTVEDFGHQLLLFFVEQEQGAPLGSGQIASIGHDLAQQ